MKNQKNEWSCKNYAVLGLAILAVTGIGWWEGRASHASTNDGGKNLPHALNEKETSMNGIASGIAAATGDSAIPRAGLPTAERAGSIGPEVLKWREKHWPGMHCPLDGPVVFYKTHKTGSTTIANMLYRYSILHQRKVFSPPGEFNHKPGCQHYELCLPKHGEPPLKPEEAYDMALHHYHSVAPQGIPESAGTWPEKWERYRLAAAGAVAPQMVSILREPAATFYSKFDYFRLRTQVGLLKTTVTKPEHSEGMSRDFGVYTDAQLAEFLQSTTYNGAFMFILEELELSLALWKASCGLSWHEVVVRQSNHRNPSARSEEKVRRQMPLVKENHVRDYTLYNTTLKKLHDARESYPDQEALAAAIKRIQTTNFAADTDCKKKPNKAYCKLENLKPLKFAIHLSPETHRLDGLDSTPWAELNNATIGLAMAQIKSLADSYTVE